MGYLKIIFYGLLAFVERNPLFTLLLVLLAIFAPVVFKVAGWIILGILLAIVVLVAIGSLHLRRMRQQMEEQMRQGGFSSGGFSGMGGMGGAANGMTLEELVRRMQAEADARRAGTASSNNTTTSSSPKSEKRVNDKVGDYVDFEEVD